MKFCGETIINNVTFHYSECRNKIIKMIIFNELFSLASISNTKIRYRNYIILD